MNPRYRLSKVFSGVVLMLAAGQALGGPGSVSTYQGSLLDNGDPVNGSYDLRFSLFDSEVGGVQIGADYFANDVAVAGGLFTTEFDFGPNAFDGAMRWLEVAVRPGDSGGAYTVLNPRQELNPTPYAQYAENAPGAGLWVEEGQGIRNDGSNFVGINRSSTVSGAEYFGIQAPVESGYGGMYIRTDGADGWPFYGYAAEGGGSMWTYYNGTTGAWNLYNGGHRMTVLNTGEVGINTTAPTWPLQVGANEDEEGIYSTGTISSYKGYEAEGPGLRVGRRASPSLFLSTFTNIDGATINSSGSLIAASLSLNNDTDANVLMATGGGMVGIGTNQPLAHLHVERADKNLSAASLVNDDIVIEDSDAGLGLYSDGTGSYGSSVSLAELDGDGALENKWSMYRTTGIATRLTFSYGSDPNYANHTPILTLRNGGFVGIGTTFPTAMLEVAGTAKVDVLQIQGADVAEKFPVSEAVEPGMVVAIDPQNPGKLCLSRGVYNRCVAGVISGAGNLPVGAVLGNLPGYEDAPPVALSGRVWVQCDATERAIQPGDLITTAERAGHGMAVWDHSRASGAVLGKAMTSLEAGETGLVLVLVNLQ